MKFGFRTPSIKKSLKARTTGKWKRKVKKSIIPFYGKKGTGWIKNPNKAAYNKVYNKVTIDPLKDLKKTSKQSCPEEPKIINHKEELEPSITTKRKTLFTIPKIATLVLIVFVPYSFFINETSKAVTFLILSAIVIFISKRALKKEETISNNNESENDLNIWGNMSLNNTI